MNILRYAFKNIFRNFFLSISSVITIGLLVFFVNVLLLVVFASNNFIQSVNNKIAIVLTFKNWYDNSQVKSQEFLSGASEKFKWVSVEYISREEALKIFKERHSDLVPIVEDANENPLPNSVRISQIPLDKYADMDAYIAQYKDILQYDAQDMNKKLVDYKIQYEQVSKIVTLLQLLNKYVYILIGLFIFTVFVVVHTVIRNFVFFLQDEVRIIELVWGKSSFIYLPLMIQGTIYTVLAVCLAVWVFFLFKNFWGLELLPNSILALFTSFYQELMNTYFPKELIVAVLIGIISAFLASYKYVHSTIRSL